MKKHCPCCGLLVKDEANYHPACLRRLFNVPWLPSIPFGLADFPSQVSQAIALHPMSISGVQKKASVALNPKSRQLEIVSIGGTHILKPENELYPQIPQVENLCMNMAECAGIEVPAHGIFSMKGQSFCYIVRRFDRLPDGTKTGQEDLQQILGATDKYKGSLESIGKKLLHHTANPGLEVISFYERVVFCFLIGNGDMHLKNWSLTEPQDKQNRLTPAYDLLCTNLYIPGEVESALTLQGKNNRLDRGDFEGLAKDLTIDEKAARIALTRLIGLKDRFLQMIEESDLQAERKAVLSSLLTQRFARLAE